MLFKDLSPLGKAVRITGCVLTWPIWLAWGVYFCVGGNPFPWNQK